MRPPLQLIEDAFRLITNNLFIYVTYAIVMTVLSVLPIFIYGMNVSAPDFSINMSYGPGYLVITLLSGLVLAAVGIALLKSFADGAEATFEHSLAYVKEHYVKFLIVFILYYITIIVGMILLFIPGILAAFFFTFAPFIVLFEGIDGVGAFKRSFQYVKGNALGVLWRFIVIGAIYVLISLAIQFTYVVAVFAEDGMGVLTLGAFISSIVHCFFLAYMYHMYLDLKGLGVQSVVSAQETQPTQTTDAQ